MGLHNNPFYAIISKAIDVGETVITGPVGLSDPFLTSRGIR